jgi:uncharacterized repeat protein (TIGR02543 family)
MKQPERRVKLILSLLLSVIFAASVPLTAGLPDAYAAQSGVVERYPIPQAVLDNEGRDFYFPLSLGASQLSGMLHEAAVFVQEEQLKKEVDWISFVEAFRSHWDDELYTGGGTLTSSWRGEFWGKVMRGACFTYEYTQDQELYAVLEATVRDILSTADPVDGHINSSTGENEFLGLAVWNVKYVLLGLEYFYDICPDAALKADVKAALINEANYICKYIGTGPGQIPINKTCDLFRSATSVSILEPMVRVYQLTGEKKYLDFAEYILKDGGDLTTIVLDKDGNTLHNGSYVGNIFEGAKAGKLPYQYFDYPHGYTLMSCFEGVLEYYRVTKDPEWLQALYNFYYSVIESDLTVLGATGCSVETFNHAVIRQTTPGSYQAMNDNFIQEMCANVTWIKLSYQMLRLTGDPMIVDQIERAGYNILLGTINFNKVNIGGPLYNRTKHMSNGGAAVFAGFSPINANRKQGYGGQRDYPSGTPGASGWLYACCMANGPNGTGILPLVNVLRSSNGLAMNLFMPGTTNVTTPLHRNVTLNTVTNYPYDGDIAVTVNLDQAETFDINLRIPQWSRKTVIKVNGEPVTNITAGTYKTLSREWKAGDIIELSLDMRGQIVKAPDGKGVYEAIQRGPIVLVHDSRFGGNINAGIKRSDSYVTNIESGGVYIKEDCEYVNLKPSPSKMSFDRMEFEVPSADGSSFKVCDYASAGNNWTSAITTWFQSGSGIPSVKDFDASGIYQFISCATNNNLPLCVGTYVHNGSVTVTHNNVLTQDRSPNSNTGADTLFALEPAGGNAYYIKQDGKYLTLKVNNDYATNGNGYLIELTPKITPESTDQQWIFALRPDGNFYIWSATNSNRAICLSGATGQNPPWQPVGRVHMWAVEDSTNAGQFWRLNKVGTSAVLGDSDCFYTFTNKASGTCAYAEADGTLKRVTAGAGGSAGSFDIVDAGGGEYYIKQGGKYVTLLSGGSISLEEQNGTGGQRWILEWHSGSASSDQYFVKSSVDGSYWSTAASDGIAARANDGSPNAAQLWIVDRVNKSDPVDTKYTLTVVNGTGGGQYSIGQTVAVNASENPSKLFERWDAIGVTLTEEQKTNPALIIDTPGNNATLTAVFGNAPYTVTLDTRGGNPADPITGVPYYGKITKPADPAHPQGFRFMRWYKDAGLNIIWDFGVDTVTRDVTLFARWDEGKTYTVTFNSAGGSAVSPIEEVDEGSKIAKPTNPVKAGRFFSGWYSDAGYTNEWDFGVDTVSGHMTLYAKWSVLSEDLARDNNKSTGDKVYNASTEYSGNYGASNAFNGDRGTSVAGEGTRWAGANSGGADGWIQVKFDRPVTITDYYFKEAHHRIVSGYQIRCGNDAATNPTTPANAVPYTSSSLSPPYSDAITWEASGSLDNPVTCTVVCLYLPNGRTATLNAFELYGRIDSQCVVTYDSGGGSAVNPETVIQGGKATRPSDPIRINSVFAGWYADASCTEAWDFDNAHVIEDITLYAKWVEGTTVNFTVTFDSVGGSDVAPVLVVQGGGKITKPDDPVLPGYTFFGWHTDAACENAWDFDNGLVTKDMTLFAKWEVEIPVYTAVFNSAGGSGVPPVAELIEGDKIPKPADPVRAGHIFEGWYKNTALTTKWDFNADTVSGDITLFARWSVLTEDLARVSNITTGVKKYTASSAFTPGDYGASNAFNGDWGTGAVGNGTRWAATNTANCWIQVEFPFPVTVTNFFFRESIHRVAPETVYQLRCGDDAATNPGTDANKKPFTRTLPVTIPAISESSICDFAGEFDTEVTAKAICLWFGRGGVTLNAFELYGRVPANCAVTFDSDGGSAVNPATVAQGGKIPKPADPVMAGFAFAGWYTDAGCTKAWDFDEDNVVEDVTLYAKYDDDDGVLTFTDGSGETLHNLSSATLNTALTYRNKSGIQEKLTMIVAVYNRDGRLVYVKSDSKDIGVGELVKFSVSLYMPENTGSVFVTEGYYANVYLWDTETLLPAANVVKLS